MKTTILIFSIAVYSLLTPMSRAQWTGIGPPGGSIYSLAISGDNVFAGCTNNPSGAGGVYRSTNN